MKQNERLLFVYILFDYHLNEAAKEQSSTLRSLMQLSSSQDSCEDKKEQFASQNISKQRFEQDKGSLQLTF